MRRICLIAVANDFLPTLLPRLPQGMSVTAQRECFDKAQTILRIEGDCLPEWCNEPPHGGPFAWGAAIFGGDGLLRILPVSATIVPPPASMYERLNEQYGWSN